MNAAARLAFRTSPDGCLISGFGDGCKITRQPEGVLKSGSRVRPEESNAMRLAYELRLPVPDVKLSSTSPAGHSILMDFVEGEVLEDIWNTLSKEEKHDIAQQLGTIVTKMRTKPRDQRPIGACGGPARDCRQYSDYSGGPFRDEVQFNEFVLDFIPTTPALIQSSLASSLQVGHRIVFTHGDLTPRNIIVQKGRICALLDWEYAGWYPEYWEYVKFFDRPTDCKDWKSYGKDIFDSYYPKELVNFQALIRWQRP